MSKHIDFNDYVTGIELSFTADPAGLTISNGPKNLDKKFIFTTTMPYNIGGTLQTIIINGDGAVHTRSYNNSTKQFTVWSEGSGGGGTNLSVLPGLNSVRILSSTGLPAILLDADTTRAGLLTRDNWKKLGTAAPLASPTFTGTVGGINRAMVGLDKVDNVASATSGGTIVSSIVAGKGIAIAISPGGVLTISLV